MAARQLTNTLTRLFWRLEDRHPEALSVAILIAGGLAGHLLAEVLI
ncbi:MAG: hypothetical protein K9L82_06455 [Chromatiaceae bacterium]|nr:hypothetical protein [Chromatiaceae bacterium]MCF7993850.1 hypothetical protein [Chromatiaceae bacterium]MCF8003870.1 hypothetical protein [Chromatiaceae bacterium]